ncbi:tautomerase family protein [Acrocarpospora catenulata]|uniref:tautomerase family protein n=1 Tax=Acrocarpospora catenulata TaxID=2836182 RepID=UPI001BD94302|nr:hypothetical protein [Acrocarpospora catenulata]
MPVLMIYLAAEPADPDSRQRLLTEAGLAIAETLDTPIERTRVFVLTAGHAAAGGQVVPPGGLGAPFFVCCVSAHRPAERRTELLARLTDVIEQTLNVDRSVIRGWAAPTEPDAWAVAGIPLSVARADEIHERER